MGLFGGKKKKAVASPEKVKALLFDVFGTTVDWHTSMTAHGERIGRERGIDADWSGLAEAWRARYKPAVKRVRDGDRPFVGFDVLHREELDKIAGKYGAKKLSPEDRDLLTHGWHYLGAWPDATWGLHRLKKHFIVGALSNGTTRQLVDLAKWSGLPWDAVFGADMFRTYKPSREMYLGAAGLLGLKPGNVLMVAAHNDDLAGAKAAGLKTCFVRRAHADTEATGEFDYGVDDFEHLAGTMGAV